MEPTPGTTEGGCGCKCDNLGYEIEFEYEKCGDIMEYGDWFESCDGCSKSYCGDYLHCYQYRIKPKDPTVPKSDCMSNGEPHVPEYIVIPLRDDCEYDMNWDSYYDRIWEIWMNEDELYIEPESDYTVHYKEDPDGKTGVHGIQIDIGDWDNNGENHFEICIFNGDSDPVPADEMDVGWAFEVKEGKYSDEYGYQCPNELELVDICTHNLYSAKVVTGRRDTDHRRERIVGDHGMNRGVGDLGDLGDLSKGKGADDTDVDLKNVVDTEPWNVKLHGLKYYEHEMSGLIGAHSLWIFAAVLATFSLSVLFCFTKCGRSTVARREGVEYGRVGKGDETEDETDSELVPIME